MFFNKLSQLLIAFLITLSLNAQQRKEIQIPDILGYKTLKCDFHMHTVFSDGLVWPTVRVQEAWLEGLDAIAITDHIEYHPHSSDITADYNRSYDIAEPAAERSGIILVRGAEITRSMPPGHLNVLFIKNANLLEREDVIDALKEARDQGAFIFWNHPGWKRQQPDSTLWWKEHTYLLKNNLLHGIEIYNSEEFYPEALTWANEKNLTILGNSDTHRPIQMHYDLNSTHRPITLVFAKEQNKSSLKEALFDRRTAVYVDNTLYGKADFLEPLFFASIHIKPSPVQLKNQGVASILITNTSDLDFELELVQPAVGFGCPETISLKAHHSTLVELTGNSEEVEQMKTLKMYYSVKNLFTAPDENLIVTLDINNL
ncbi:hypothetical protein MNBD_BACTEROID01-2676 [hydrothermal vent metagenome]|uniref:Polymerase/histidinol phosphatase N-terminal domain-containing protein n=1 Tax=hydrothermal vent metagenome TaxID=652676 RepID=A0A3B0TZF7_9ZZZZ